MNTERLTILADQVEAAAPDAKPDLGFNMKCYWASREERPLIRDHTDHNCETVACLAGWTCHLFGYAGRPIPVPEGLSLNDAIHDLAAQLLELTSEEAVALFVPTPSNGWLSGIPLEKAVRAVRETAATGKVPLWWSVDVVEN